MRVRVHVHSRIRARGCACICSSLLITQVGAVNKHGVTKCGNPVPESIEPMAKEEPLGVGRQLTAVNVTTYGWVYVFPGEKERA